MSGSKRIYVLGAGVAGLAAGLAGAFPVFEARQHPGGICRSYYMSPGSSDRKRRRSADGGEYRFEVGGGHWIHSRHASVARFIESLAPARVYRRNSAAYFRDLDLYVPYPVQRNISSFPPDVARVIRSELDTSTPWPDAAMTNWFRRSFGPTLSQLFFEPFHDMYTAGLTNEIAPGDSYKTPSGGGYTSGYDSAGAGYNSEFIYPAQGLSTFIDGFAGMCEVHYSRSVISIDTDGRTLAFSDGSTLEYDALIATIPLDQLQRLTGIDTVATPDPSTSALVINIGARRGIACPPHHWLYIPRSRSGFHRVGFYSNVDASFLPESRDAGEFVSLYVEISFPRNARPDRNTIASISARVAEELAEWGFIGDTEVADATWVETAYTWLRPGSRWREELIRELRARGVFPAGRYALWKNCGMADSIRDGFLAGYALAPPDRTGMPEQREILRGLVDAT
jgi:protoporphyrinogen oxidase